ncbi:MAG: CPBP family intramembrane glutamic endopeptidase [Sporolactobacillus sp.]|uniref:CPBP family intramembrane glutamic endopeptidase n=1 Tax=Sporolactobacillus sp. STSJ-5 TaxID=2965076 RepID=UPI0021072A77|nr:CPBP family intramembrane glutamic endopeptidase [Sporolactobacillus sp. STSJ-5]MCQ2010071.1 CPBP family intramembrane metalloprotease [Sporolactobacillus sp. STSJ-5]
MSRTDLHLSDSEMRRALYFSQGLLLLLSMTLIKLFNLSFPLATWYKVNGLELMIGFSFGVGMVSIQAIAEHVLPNAWFDDKGINEHLLRAFPLSALVLIMAAVSLIEETLFRGILQHLLGYVAASLIFVFLHIRYVTKPALLGITLVLSFGLGFLFVQTGSLLTPITAHFTINTLPIALNYLKKGRL